MQSTSAESGRSTRHAERDIVAEFRRRTPRSAIWYERASCSLAAGTTGNLRHFRPYPLYFASGRLPPLPSVYFHDVASPLPPAEIERAAARVGLRWVVVEERRQAKEVLANEDDLVSRLTRGMSLVERVGPYAVYRR